jgi:hypothetical protein
VEKSKNKHKFKTGIVSQEMACALWQSKSATTQHFRNLQIESADLGRRFQFRDHLHLCFEENNKQRVDREVHEPTW